MIDQQINILEDKLDKIEKTPVNPDKTIENYKKKREQNRSKEKIGNLSKNI